MTKVSEMQDQIRQAASKLADELIAKAIELEGRDQNPPSLRTVIIRMSAVNDPDLSKVTDAVSVSSTVGDQKSE
jgi:hypothetical protein